MTNLTTEQIGPPRNKVAREVDGKSGEKGTHHLPHVRVMSLSPKHTTPFSVTDILSPIEETYRRTTIEASIPPLAPYRNPSHQGSQTAMATMSSMGGMSVPVTNPYSGYVPPLSHHTPPFTTQYCNGTDFTPYGDPVRHSSTNWYNPNPDPRFASKCTIGLVLCTMINKVDLLSWMSKSTKDTRCHFQSTYRHSKGGRVLVTSASSRACLAKLL